MGGVEEQPVDDVDLLGVFLWSDDSVTTRLVFKGPVWKQCEGKMSDSAVQIQDKMAARKELDSRRRYILRQKGINISKKKHIKFHDVFKANKLSVQIS